MQTFPKEFGQILTTRGRTELLARTTAHPAFLTRKGDTPLCNFPHAVSRHLAARMVKLLDQEVLNHLNTFTASRIDARELRLPRSYARFATERSAPFSKRVKSSNACKQYDEQLYRIAVKIGLLKFLQSAELRHFLRKLTGERLRFGTGVPYVQIACYEAGDYIGPHTDWIASNGKTEYFLLFQLSLPNEGVDSQALLYQRGDFMDGMVNHAGPTVTVLRLPFWHMTTPLQARPGWESRARRWLVTAAFQICEWTD